MDGWTEYIVHFACFNIFSRQIIFEIFSIIIRTNASIFLNASYLHVLNALAGAKKIKYMPLRLLDYLQ